METVVNIDRDEWVTGKEACQLLSVSDEYLAQCARSGLVEKRRLVNALTGKLSRNVRYSRSDVLGLLRAQRP